MCPVCIAPDATGLVNAALAALIGRSCRAARRNRSGPGLGVEAPQRRPLHDAVIPRRPSALRRASMATSDGAADPSRSTPSCTETKGRSWCSGGTAVVPVFGRPLQLHDQLESSQYSPRRPTCGDSNCAARVCTSLGLRRSHDNPRHPQNKSARYSLAHPFSHDHSLIPLTTRL